MIGIIVSGSAVPTAASTLPTAARGESEAVAKPLDGVGEELSRDQDDEQRYGDEKDG